jgi:hypothetical protein
MKVKTFTPEVKLSKMVLIERVCSFCNKSWNIHEKIDVIGKGATSLFRPDSKEMTKAKDRANLDLKRKEKDASIKHAGRDVLCPSCKHFSNDAMAKYFPNGYQAGIKKEIKKDLLLSLLFIPLCGLGAVLLVPAIFEATQKEWKEAWVVIILSEIIGLFLAILSIPMLVKLIRILGSYKRITTYLQTKNEDGLLDLAVSFYEASENSLDKIDWGIMLLNRSKSNDN